ncbi:MAG: 30S ribosomal protein S13 [Mycoplasmataceae bacterium RC_NB112A]|nr:MAG: 30S ribosomal protein S13 [Mycoplasmataceae bacterium RC_NB112A]KLL01883.1 MAG: 30S ribosomal protein S13 [Mycoplasmataceae bacterium RC_NB112A]
MVRIGEVDIPNQKWVFVSLTKIDGIGDSLAHKILQKCEINPFTKTKDLTQEQINKIIQELKNYLTGKDLWRKIEKDKKILVRTGTRRGLRAHIRDYITGKFRPAHGQRSRRNAQTAKCGARPGKRTKIAIAGRKAAPSPK